MFSSTQSTFPIIILITDGAVEDERDICDILESHMTKSRSLHPRIYTFGIGKFVDTFKRYPVWQIYIVVLSLNFLKPSIGFIYKYFFILVFFTIRVQFLPGLSLHFCS